MNTNNPLDLTQLRALHEAATKGNWFEGGVGNLRAYGPDYRGKESGPVLSGHGWRARENLSFAVAIHNAFPALADRLAELQELNAEEVEAEATLIAADWEKDCAKSLRLIAESLGFEWNADGNPADELQEHITETVRDLRDRLEAAEREREELYRTQVERDHWRQLLVSLDMESLCDAHLGIGVEEYLHKWLADRDASMKALGAAEWLEAQKVSQDGWLQLTGGFIKSEAARLRREAGSV